MKTKIIFFLILNSSFLISNCFSQMFWNNTCQFAGNSGSYISVPNSSTINITGSFSIEAWVCASAPGAIKGILSKGGALGTSLKYGLRLSNTGRLTLTTNGASRLLSRLSNPVPADKWTHVAATYNSSTNLFSIYINAILDTSTTIAGVAPTTNSDSLFIGISGSTSPFRGQLDEVRLWNRDLSASEIGQNFRTTLGATSGMYSGLVFSMTFQKENSSGTRFSTNDFSGNNNNGNVRNITPRDYSFNPQHTISQNDCAEFDGTEDYLAAKDTSTISPATELTLEFWIYPRSNSNCNIITKGNSYSLTYESGIMRARINGGSPISYNHILPINRWSHIAFTYSSILDSFAFYLNFQTPGKGVFNSASINSNTDSLYIGGFPGVTGDLNGYMDEVRICNYVKSTTELDRSVYNSIEVANDPDLSNIDISYCLDGNTTDNSENGGPRLLFRNNSRFSHPATLVRQPVSPVNRNSSNEFWEGFYLNTAVLRIPPTGSSGALTSFLNINLNSITISDVNLFVALNHTNTSNLEIILTNPDGDSVKVFDNNTSSTLDNNIITTFDDQADSSLVNARYSSFYARIKPSGNMNSLFSGKSPIGSWKLTVRDEAANDTGVIYAWGIQFNNQSTRETDLECSAYLQGFYNPSTNLMIQDTMTVYLREFNSPYTIVDSSKRFFGISGNGLYSFENAVNDHKYYLQLKHRNSIETWSSIGVSFRNNEVTFNFNASLNSAFGSNQIQVDSSPFRVALYGGDSNQDGSVDATDIVAVFNDANNFTTGYVSTDMTGDDFVDAADLVLTFNNANNFISVITP